MSELLRRLRKEDEGQDLVEYALLLALIALAGVGAMKALGSALGSVFYSAANNLSVS